ncbi:MAG: response regulator transcription factor [Marinisporobacter sp.]|jgi:DNA-binding response OmpR family regulator|nr:response regulator transcription factor [Marinisporobacter sp.]
MNKHTILVVDDDLDIIELISLYLKNSGYIVDTANNCNDALEKIKSKCFDLIILDIMLPDFDGTTLCQKIRQSMYCPIIFVSCIDDEDYILNALNLGGDDYIRKPFNPRELVARVQSNLRRVAYEKSGNKLIHPHLTIKDLTLNMEKYTVIKNNKEITLSPIEFNILLFMIHHPNKILRYSEIYEHVWESKSIGDTRTVMVHVSNLRKKIENNSNIKYIKTVKRRGYMFLL